MELSVNIRDIRLNVVIGTDPDERANRQQVVLDVAIRLADSAAAESDDLADAVDYRELVGCITEELAATRYQLLERLVAHAASIIMDDARVSEVTVTAAKPGAMANGTASVTCRQLRR